ncbi:MAG TPA: hemerythrin domain-containing protein [Terriglobales bacterium]|nr:hemerythrin domain-containing protein [Terriglobales bacterium]
MWRDPSLRSLSREHQHGLALCVRLRRRIQQGSVAEAELQRMRADVRQFYESEAREHFDAEEQVLFPVADRHAELRLITRQLRLEHVELRRRASEIDAADAKALAVLAELLSNHIRKEENELFEGMQKLMSADELQGLAEPLEAALTTSGAHCELRRPQ